MVVSYLPPTAGSVSLTNRGALAVRKLPRSGTSGRVDNHGLVLGIR